MNKNIPPNLFVVGAAKAGTTSLYSYLNSHRSIYMSPIKEPHFFSTDIRCSNFSRLHRAKNCFNIKKYLKSRPLKPVHIAYFESEEDYIELYSEVQNETVIGEVSTGYLFSHTAAKNIYQFNPRSKIIIMLRNPVERAFSHWLMDLREGNVKEKEFLDAVKNDYQSSTKAWGKDSLYIELGLYYEQVKRFYDIFPKNQISIHLYEEYRTNQELSLKDIYEFLNVSSVMFSEVCSENSASLPKHGFIPKLINFGKHLRIHRIVNKKVKEAVRSFIFQSKSLPVLSGSDYKEVYEYFKSDIKKLEELLEIDLSVWREKSRKD